jgi:CDP-diacylglycerol--glycerol-3-phosphate 3-phosphatidyltransferase
MEYTVPNILTLLRIPLLFAIVVVDLLRVPAAGTWVLLLFALSMLSDFLDGYLARLLKQTSQFGKIADPLLDKFFIIGMLMWMQASGSIAMVHLPVILLLFLRELTITGMRGSSGLGADWYGKWKTTFLFVALLVILIHRALVMDYAWSVESIAWLHTVGVVCLWAGCLLGVVSGFRYIKAWNHQD